jgi:hypothetical protein
MTTILGISGSLRSGSFNTHLLAAAAQLTDAGTTLDVASIRGVPLYDGDVETTSGLPQAVRDLKARVVATDGLLLVSPEYNNRSGRFKTRSTECRGRRLKLALLADAVAVIERFARRIARSSRGCVVAGAAYARDGPWFDGRLLIARAHKAFNDRGTDRRAVRSQLRDFVRFARLSSQLATGK